MEKKTVKVHLLKIIGSRFLYFVAGMLIVSTVVVYAAWSDAQTGGSGKLSEFNWNSLITQLQAIPTAPANPGGWACNIVTGTNIASCAAGEALVNGGCNNSGSTIQSGSFPMNTGAGSPIGSSGPFAWRCVTAGIQAYALCCK